MKDQISRLMGYGNCQLNEVNNSTQHVGQTAGAKKYESLLDVKDAGKGDY